MRMPRWLQLQSEDFQDSNSKSKRRTIDPDKPVCIPPDALLTTGMPLAFAADTTGLKRCKLSSTLQLMFFKLKASALTEQDQADVRS